MDARVVATIRRGQAEMQDQVLTGLLIEKGVLSPIESAELTADSPPGSVAGRLFEDGRISPAQLEQLSDEMDLLESLDTAVEDATPERVREAAREPASRVGKYVLVEKIGVGGMGEVWRAWDYGLGRWVALKFLKVRDDKLIRRFMREATLLARLSHPNITQVFEVGIHDGRPFLCMELVEGGSPGKEALPRRQATEVILEAARGVAYAHSRDIIHRDLKPSNLLISNEGRVFVTDFGLARLQSEGGSLTASGAVLGTPSYMAPEQAQGVDADSRTDVYGLGATLFGLVEGSPPFVGETAVEIVHRVASAPTPEISGTRDDLTVVARKAMERDRRDWYQTTGELADDLQRYLDDEPVLAQPITSVERIWRKARRRPLYSALMTAGVTLALGLGVWGAGWLGDQRRLAKADAVLEQVDPLVIEYQRYAQAGTWDSPEAKAAIEAMRPAIDEALEIAPEHVGSRLYLARYLRWTEDWEGGLAVLDALLEEHPEAWDAYVDRAKIRLSQTGGTGWAPDPLVITSMGGLEFEYEPPPAEAARLIEQARADYESLPEEHDERPQGLAVVSYFAGDYAAAAERLGTLVEREGFRNQARRMLLWSLLPLGHFAEAEALAEQLRAGGIFVADALEARALAAASQARFAEAARTAAIYLELYPRGSSRITRPGSEC